MYGLEVPGLVVVAAARQRAVGRRGDEKIVQRRVEQFGHVVAAGQRVGSRRLEVPRPALESRAGHGGIGGRGGQRVVARRIVEEHHVVASAAVHRRIGDAGPLHLVADSHDAAEIRRQGGDFVTAGAGHRDMVRAAAANQQRAGHRAGLVTHAVDDLHAGTARGHLERVVAGRPKDDHLRPARRELDHVGQRQIGGAVQAGDLQAILPRAVLVVVDAGRAGFQFLQLAVAVVAVEHQARILPDLFAAERHGQDAVAHRTESEPKLAGGGVQTGELPEIDRAQRLDHPDDRGRLVRVVLAVVGAIGEAVGAEETGLGRVGQRAVGDARPASRARGW